MKISIIEANMTAYQHSYPNSVYIKIFTEIFGKDNVEIYCSDEHFKCMGFQKWDHIINHVSIKVVPGNKNMIKKFFYEYYYTFKTLKCSSSDLIIFLSSCPDIQLPLISYMKNRNVPKIIIMTHGELEGLVMGEKWKFWSYPFWISRCFKRSLPHSVARIVLGKSISDNLQRLYNEKNIYYIDQPRDGFKEKNCVIPKEKRNIYAFIGDFLTKKGGETFKKAAKTISNTSSEFWLIGPYHEDIGENIKTFCGPDQYLNKREFDSLIEKITYACFPYPESSYKFTASGAVLDAIRFLKPIVYIQNDYFDGIFENSGNIGYRCKDESEFYNTLIMLDKNINVEKYNQQIENLKKLQGKFQEKTIECELKKIVDSVMELPDCK